MKRVSVALVTFGLTAAQAHAKESFPLLPSGGHGSQQAALGRQGAGHWIDSCRSFIAKASYYGGGPRKYEPSAYTASGERFDMWGLTAAHRTLPLGTRLLVSHGDRSVVVRVNDRGPAAWTGRSLDLSRGAATALGLIARGVGQVSVSVLGRS